MPVRTPPAVAKRLKIGRGSPRPAERRSEPPLHPAPKVHATTGKTEPPPSTNVARVTEITTDGDWVRRTPSALLILPPPPQFADTSRPTHRRPSQPSLRPSLPLLPASLPSRSNTAAPAMRPSRSHIAAPAARLARSHGKQTDETDGPTPTHRMEDAVRTSYATIAATPTHHSSNVQPTPATNNTQAPAPSQQPMLPTLVVKRLPNWVGHFRTIAAALGHVPNARAHKKGAMFLPKTEEELRTVQRCLEEAAASDSAISFEIRKHNPSEEEEAYPRHTSPAEPTATRQGATPLPATAELCDDAPPKTIPAASVASDVTQAGTDTYVSPAPLTRRRRRKRAPRPTFYSPMAASSRRPPLLPTPTAGRTPTQAHTPCYDRPTPVAAPRSTLYSHQAPSSLDLTVRVILEALTTGIAAYLREQGAMPAMKHPSPYRALNQEWQARAGGIPAQKSSPGK